jgi:hypothetical protein
MLWHAADRDKLRALTSADKSRPPCKCVSRAVASMAVRMRTQQSNGLDVSPQDVSGLGTSTCVDHRRFRMSYHAYVCAAFSAHHTFSRLPHPAVCALWVRRQSCSSMNLLEVLHRISFRPFTLSWLELTVTKTWHAASRDRTGTRRHPALQSRRKEPPCSEASG